MNPYLKGLHLTIDSWRPNRDKETGWPLKYLTRDDDGDWVQVTGAEDAPESVNPTGDLRRRLERDVQCLTELLSGENPAERTCRAVGTVLAAYLVGDAS